MIITSEYLENIAEKYWPFYEDEQLLIGHTGDLPPELEEKLGSFHFGRSAVAELKNIALCGPAGVGVTAEGSVVLDTAYAGRLDVLERNKPYLSAAFEYKNTVEPVVVPYAFPMVSTWSHNYFHWTLEMLTKLEGLEIFLRGQPKPVAILENDPPQFAIDTIERAGYEWRTMDGGHLLVERLVVPTFRRKQGRTSPRALYWIRHYFSDDIYPIPTHRTVYIDRHRASERRVTNWSEVDLDYSLAQPETMPWVDQVGVFKDAKMIISAHGAGLTNMIYAPEGCHIVELFGSYVNPCYFTIAKALGFKYTPIMCEPVGKDLKVNGEELCRLLSEL